MRSWLNIENQAVRVDVKKKTCYHLRRGKVIVFAENAESCQLVRNSQSGTENWSQSSLLIMRLYKNVLADIFIGTFFEPYKPVLDSAFAAVRL